MQTDINLLLEIKKKRIMTDDVDLRSDTEMTETETVNTAQQHSQDDAVRQLLALARQLITQGKPSQALQAVRNPSDSSLMNFLFVSASSFSHYLHMKSNFRPPFLFLKGKNLSDRSWL